MKLSGIEDVYQNLYIGEHTIDGQKKNIIGADTISVNPTRIAVFGVGGGGVNAINHMVQSGLEGVSLYAANTDVQTLQTSLAQNVVPLGQKTCRGLGVGGDPMRGAESAKEMQGILEEVIRGYDMVFFASGFGGGTGTGATPIIADIARDCGVLSVGIVTMPFTHEGTQRMKNAQQGLEDLESIVDALLVIPNDNILSSDVISPDLSIDESFTLINKILSNAVSAITDIITIPGKINIDFADIEACLRSAGRVSIGIGFADASHDSGGSAHRATDIALKNKIIDKENSATLQTAEKIIVNVIAGQNVPVPELLVVPNLITDRVKGAQPMLKFGYRIEPNWNNEVQVTIIASSPNAAGTATKDIFASMHSIQNKAMHQQKDFGATHVQEDVSESFVDAHVFSKLSGITPENEEDTLSELLNTDELNDPALERLVGLSASSEMNLKL